MLNTKTSTTVIDDFVAEIEKRPSFAKRLVQSLTKAKTTAENTDTGLTPELFKLLDWPLTVDEYVEFLRTFARYRPFQGTAPGWENPATGYAQEVYDQLCHFYFLVDQEIPRRKCNKQCSDDGTTTAQEVTWFAEFLSDYASLWGSFLDTPESFDAEVLQSFIDTESYRVWDSMITDNDGSKRSNLASGWLTFNQFFSRQLNPGLRPIEFPSSNQHCTAAADCTFRAQYPIDANGEIASIRMKKTHAVVKISDLLKGSKYADAFKGGTFVHYFLSPYSYHRFHTPVDGWVEECYPVQGLTYLDVKLKDGQFDAPDNSEDGYEFAQSRGVVTIDTTTSPAGNVGIVAIVPIGMSQVSAVNMTLKPERDVAKGIEFGYFTFGGSDIIMLYQAGQNPIVDVGGQYRHYGTVVAELGSK
eukprot:m.14251 g.14251  ORF g.14251 m.14251 type:complete len:415 (-) comp10060_c0_seq1:189-1433(-)